MADNKLGDRVAYDLKRYVELRIDDAKLAAVEGLATVTGKAVALVVSLFLATLALMLFTGVFVYLVNLVVNSWPWSAVIIGLIYLIAAFLILNSTEWFAGKMLGIFAPMFFGGKHEEEDEDEYDE